MHRPYSPAHWPIVIIHKPGKRQHKAAWLPPDRGLLLHNMDGSVGTVGFEVIENPTLLHPTHCFFSFFFSFFYNIVLLSHVCVLGYGSLNEVSRPLVSLNGEVNLLSIMECYLVSARHLKVTYHLSLLKRKRKTQLISCFFLNSFSYTDNGISLLESGCLIYALSRVPC